MATTIIKPDRNDDFYVQWESIVEAPTAFGTRSKMLKMFKNEGGKQAKEHAKERLARADQLGTSAMWPSRAAPAYGFEDDKGMIYEQKGWIPRHNLKALCLRLAEDQKADVSDLLIPLEEDN